MPALLSRLVPLCVAVTPLCCVASHCLLQTAGRGRTAGDGGPTLRICNKTSSSQIISPSYICYTRGGWQAGNFVMTIQSLSDDQPQLCCHYKVAACWWRNNMLVLNHPHASSAVRVSQTWARTVWDGVTVIQHWTFVSFLQRDSQSPLY